MTSSQVAWELLYLIPLMLGMWALVLRREADKFEYLFAFWLPLILLLILSFPLGGFLAVMVALTFEQPLVLVSISWVEHPFQAAKMFFACSSIGGFASYGLFHLTANLIRVMRPLSICSGSPKLGKVDPA